MEKDKIKGYAFIIFLIFFFLFLYTKLGGPIQLSVNSINSNKESLFSAQGTGKTTAIPDKAKISLGVTESSASLEDAKSRLNQKTNKIIQGLLDQKVDKKDIKTTSYFISPIFRANQTVGSFTISQNLEILAPIDLVNQIVDSATSSGANLSSGIEFILDDEKKIELEDEARKEAIAQAKKRANSIANASGLRLGRVVNVVESGDIAPRPIIMETKQAEDVESLSNIPPGENTVEITVTVSFETY